MGRKETSRDISSRASGFGQGDRTVEIAALHTKGKSKVRASKPGGIVRGKSLEEEEEEDRGNSLGSDGTWTARLNSFSSVAQPCQRAQVRGQRVKRWSDPLRQFERRSTLAKHPHTPPCCAPPALHCSTRSSEHTPRRAQPARTPPRRRRAPKRPREDGPSTRWRETRERSPSRRCVAVHSF